MFNDYIFCLFAIQYDDFEDSDGVTSEGKNFLCPGPKLLLKCLNCLISSLAFTSVTLLHHYFTLGISYSATLAARSLVQDVALLRKCCVFTCEGKYPL